MTNSASIAVYLFIVVAGIVLFQRGCTEWATTIQENHTERARIEAAQEE